MYITAAGIVIRTSIYVFIKRAGSKMYHGHSSPSQGRRQVFKLGGPGLSYEVLLKIRLTCLFQQRVQLSFSCRRHIKVSRLF